ncbi:MAG: radical SAM protein, partial [Candidatus Omnitrophica bacterium]|nr:radical SAM protein [Candidatus Omnitrophota bacterium]
MRVIFVNPRYREWVKSLPLGIAYLAGILVKQGHWVRVIDANAEELNTADVSEHIKLCKVDMVCITSVTAQIYSGWDIAQAVKKENPAITVVIGGVHPSAMVEESLGKEFIDFVVRGEGEVTLTELIDCLEHKGGIEKVDGISYKKGNCFQNNPKRSLIDNLDALPFPARDLFPFPYKYSSPFKLKKLHATLITSRGCPGGCIFCNKNIFGSVFRMRSAENVIMEIEYLAKEYGIKEFHMADDCFSWDRNRVEQICELLIRKKLNVAWACSNGIRVDSVDKKLLELMKESGCYRIAFGVESGSEEVLKKIGKRIHLDEIKHAFEMAELAGIATVALFMLGNFGDDTKNIEKTIEFSKSLATDYAQFTIAVPFPGTPFFKIIEQKGRFLSRDWKEFGVFSKPLFELNGLTADLMSHMYKKAYREFYFRPSQIGRILYKRLISLSFRDLVRLFN